MERDTDRQKVRYTDRQEGKTPIDKQTDKDKNTKTDCRDRQARRK
jgi:hypothetical protein